MRADLRLGSLYNSNLFQYSAEDQSAFLRHAPASRFGIQTIDDAGFRGVASLSVSRRLVGSRVSRLSGAFTKYAYAKNPIKDKWTWRLSFHQPFLRTAWTEISYAHSPQSYLRHLWDSDFAAPYQSYPHYQAAYLKTREFQLESGFRASGRWVLSGHIAYAGADYNPAFRERDAKDWEAVLGVDWGKDGDPTLSLSPGLSWRRAEGTDPAHPEIPDSLRSDPSYRRWMLTLAGTIPSRSWRWFPLDLRAQVGFEHRAFVTDRALDLSHHNRKDDSIDVSLNLERRLRRGISLYGGARFESQRTQGIATGGSLGEVASFRQVAAGGGIHLSWSGATG